MYPTISHLLDDLLGISVPLPIATFGFFLIFSLYIGSEVLKREIRRKKTPATFPALEETTVEGKPPSVGEIILASFWSFLIGFKVVEAFLHYSDLVADPQSFILSTRGHFAGGLIFGLFTAFTRFIEGQKNAESKPKTVKRIVEPEEHVGTMLVVAGVSGVLGSKIAHNLEHIDLLIADPVGQLLGFTGLSFYGGLILGAICTIWYARKKQISTIHLLDAISPTLILGYGLGRIGCQLSGDGDWGIQNTAPKPDWMSFLPDWAWSFTYPNNVLSAGVPIEGCTGKYCAELPVPVFPTPLYEVIMCLAIFGILWALRTKIRKPGILFGIYMMFNGVERFLIEKIRVNPPYKFLGIEATQAELIAAGLFLGGLITLLLCMKKSTEADASQAVDVN